MTSRFRNQSAALLPGRGSRLARRLARVRLFRRLLGPLHLRGFEADGAVLAGTFLDELNAEERRPLLVEVPGELCRISGLLAFPTDVRRFNPFLQTLLAVRRRQISGYQQSPLRRYHEAWQPRSAGDLLGIPERQLGEGLRDMPPYAAVWPWHRDTPQERMASVRLSITEENRAAGLPAPEQAGHENFGPVRKDKGELEFERLVSLMEQIERKGYRRHSWRDGDIEGTVLRSGPTAAVLVKKGKHRACALAALGYRRFPIRLFSSRRGAVDCREASQWATVRSGLLTESDAVAIVRRMIAGELPFDRRLMERRTSRAD